eukprot:11533335-Alexandrium_andersonii.AAC.1
MAILSVLMTVWINVMEANHGDTIVRVLADDILLMTGMEEDLSEQMAHEKHADAVEASVAVLQAMGARVSAAKSATLASSKWLRQTWRRHVVPGLCECMTVRTEMRDLGAHLSFGARL